MTRRQTLYFEAPGQVRVRQEDLPKTQPNQVLVQSICSAISTGSEKLVYRGQSPQNLKDSHDDLSTINYPLAYGYACVGQVVDVGTLINPDWLGKLVFGFQPHTSHFLATPESLLPLPDEFSALTACFLPNMETAVNLVQDAAPVLGEKALVLGQGIVGLLTTALLKEFPLIKLITTDYLPLRRQASTKLGATCIDASQVDRETQLENALAGPADFCIEISGSPAALNTAIRQTGFGGRVVIGSWYGDKVASLELGGSFHRSRIQLIASQVSSINPVLSARWDKARRFDVAWQALKRIQPEQWITQRFKLNQAADVYKMLDANPAESLQVVFEY